MRNGNKPILIVSTVKFPCFTSDLLKSGLVILHLRYTEFHNEKWKYWTKLKMVKYSMKQSDSILLGQLNCYFTRTPLNFPNRKLKKNQNTYSSFEMNKQIMIQTAQLNSEGLHKPWKWKNAFDFARAHHFSIINYRKQFHKAQRYVVPLRKKIIKTMSL